MQPWYFLKSNGLVRVAVMQKSLASAQDIVTFLPWA